MKSGIAGAAPELLVKRALAGGVLSGVTNDEKLTIIAAGKASSAMTSAFASAINNPVHAVQL